ncbi:MAG: low-specificity L-threonine aldolase [Ignavibacteriae bacterium]|nr:low-specificity L-threonine aldolase [Ignavibacteriota bacterium]
MKNIDLRSDTITKPSKEMRQAMFDAEVGDDVFSEDPTVNKLQEKCVEISGKEKALYVPSGCMANQLAVKAHTQPGDEVICESECHIFNYETAAPAILSNVQMMTVRGEYGVMQLEEIKKFVRTKEYYFPRTRLICLENTHNRAGGVIQPIEVIKEISEFAKEIGIMMHMDGARIFNASIETGISVKEYSSYFDSISFCFSKGLGAPVGSILCGPADFIAVAHKWRKIIGGGMRQAGVIAAAALYALENNTKRLKEDNDKAKYFAKEISKIKEVSINLEKVHTNIVIFANSKYPKPELISKLKENGVLISAGSFENLRAVFHLDVTMEETEEAVRIFKTLF